MTQTVTSPDGTHIGFDQHGTGPAVILIASALSTRKDANRLARHLAADFIVVNYDRRGRGDSGHTMPYSIAREIEDIEKLIERAGGQAHLFGSSSGAVLALEAAHKLGSIVTALALFEPPINIGTARAATPPDLLDRINRLVAANNHSDAVRSFMRDGLGVPAFGVAIMRLLPMWSTMKKLAATLPYDLTITATNEPGSHPSLERWATIAAPAIVMAGTKSDQFLQVSAQSLADTLPHARYRALEGKNHSALVTAARLLAEEITAFFKQVLKG